MDYGAPLHCQHCGTLNDPRSSSLTGIPACVSCGLTSVEGAFSMQDELSKLFDRGMTFTQPLSTAPHEQQSHPGSPEVRPVLGYSASQHYIPVTRPVLSPEPEAQEQAENLPLACEQLLLQHGINPSGLQAAQKTLFLYATPEQRNRLLELWAAYGHGQSRDADVGMAMDLGASKSSLDASDSAEPYIRSGYAVQRDEAPRDSFSPFGTAVGNKSEYKQSLDPAFHQGASQEWWRHGQASEQQQPMEHQYGMFQAMRQYHVPIDDDEML